MSTMRHTDIGPDKLADFMANLVRPIFFSQIAQKCYLVYISKHKNKRLNYFSVFVCQNPNNKCT